jgi:GNAT superfamily N-acetyltransferase
MISIRPVRPEDMAVVCVHRRRMFAESGVAETTLDAMQDPFAVWLAPRLEDGSYFGFMAEEDGVVVAGVGLRLIEWPPGPLHPNSDLRGYVLNVFVEPEYRGRGIASQLMTRGDEEFLRRGVVYEMLHATEMGKPIYERLGWVAGPEMSKVLG